MKKIRAIIAAVMILGDAIEAVEKLFPKNGAGRWKLAAVLDIVAARVSGILDTFDEIRPTIVALIDKAVAARNELDAWWDSVTDDDEAPAGRTGPTTPTPES